LFNIPFYYNINFNGKDYAKSEDITLTSNDELLEKFKAIVKPLYEKDNLHNHIKYAPFKDCHEFGRSEHIENNPNPDWWCVKIANIRGHGTPANPNNDFYTLLSNDIDEIKKASRQYKIMSQDKNKNGQPLINVYWAFDNVIEQKAFINYCMTDFLRTCLYLIKSNTSLTTGEMQYIPWFDFSESIFSKSPFEIDDYLFEKYEISNKIRNHIFRILPDYYSIRKKVSSITFDGKEYDSTEDISSTSNDELLESIKNKINCTQLNNNIHNHISKKNKKCLAFPTVNINTNFNYVCRLIPFAGSGSVGKTGESFYTVISKNDIAFGDFDSLSKIINKDKVYLQYYIGFNTLIEAKNCFNYLKTDFVRICLYFIKTTLHLDNGELKYVPWQDFTEEWDDYKLFKKYNITKEEIARIYEVLPNYYNIERINLDEY